MFFRLALSSLWNRRGSAVLTFLAIAVSVFVLLGVEQIRHQARSSFGNTVSGIDLVVGARTGDINLLLYSVFRLGNATNNLAWQSYRDIAADPNVAWTIPISLGDSHQGYRVMGTTTDYFTHFRFGQGRSLALAMGSPFSDLFDVVLGSEVARTLGYRLGDELTLAHGLGSTSFSRHDANPFRVAGILEPTGTPVDQTLHVSLEGIEAIHIGWQGGVKLPGLPATVENIKEQDLTPESITAFMVGLKSRLATFRLQRQINTYPGEPLTAILPGVTLTQLWQMMAVMENTLRLISALVLLASLLGLAAMLLASIRERQREIAVMRAIGASPWFLLALVEAEALLITVGATLAAVALLALATSASRDALAERFSLFFDSSLITPDSLVYLLAIVAGALAIGLIPGITAYRRALQQQLG
ncbi:ABC transporter permease [Parahaliea mediterranea]|uniref:ABC transporter permease n=1 Tax=Parahaliea mediterranea TaxID=651086 RepID=A0A939DDA1_9GAMM|nr:ABC transporter permease [Parahaliea mediterranea]MBN7796078.1 ABC transporter permease [Parahaliea mediterranea]